MSKRRTHACRLVAQWGWVSWCRRELYFDTIKPVMWPTCQLCQRALKKARGK